MHSLRRRAILGGFIWAVISMLVCGFALLSVFDSIANRRFDDQLAERHLQVVSILGFSLADPGDLELYLTDPAYQMAYSGKYWQVEGPDRQVIASRSLFDDALAPADETVAAKGFWTGAGPRGPIRGITETVTLDDGTEWRVSVASSLADLLAERRSVRRNVLIAFGFAGLFGVAGAFVLTSAVLRPLSRMREEVAHRWDRGEALDVGKYPTEVAPLVDDINALLSRNREIVDRGRRQAADLAHALKTPSAALRNELLVLSRQKAPTAAALDALDRIDAQIGRSLARIRAANASAFGQVRTDLAQSLSRLARLFRSMPLSEGKSLDVQAWEAVQIPMDRQDLEEMLGNLLENAFKWCRTSVEIAVARRGDHVEIRIGDDGDGISEQRRATALQAGARLDTQVAGTGLGLAISQDLAKAYGGGLDLGRSGHLGGLEVVVTLPLVPVALSPPKAQPVDQRDRVI